MTNTLSLFDTTPETTSAAAKLDVIEFPYRHKRGMLKAFGVKMFDPRVIVARSNKHFIERYGKDKTYLVNNWQHPAWIDGVAQGEAQGKITYVRTLKEARALADRLVREGVAAGVPARW